MKGYIIIGLLMILSLACIPDEGILLKEDRLTGSWQAEKVLYKENGKIPLQDISGSTGNVILDLHHNSRVQYKNVTVGRDSWGTWEMHPISSLDDRYRKAEYQLIIALSHFDEHLPKELVGYVVRLSKNQFEFHIPDEKGEKILYLSRRSE